MSPALGSLIDDPLAIAARENSANWPMELLVPTALPVPDDFDTDCGPVLDQGSVGACVAFSATAVRSYQEKLDEGIWAFNSASAFQTYDWLKHGHGAYPGDGIPNTEGSYPLAVWQMAKVEGIPGIDGKPRQIEAYYQLKGTPGSVDWIDIQIQVLLQFGDFTISAAWPNNWWSANSATGLLPYPSGVAGGHMWVRKGFWLKGPTGSLSNGLSQSGRYWRHRQSWGTYGKTDKFGRTGEFLLPFEADAGYPNLGINEVWKTVDIIDAPTPGGPDVIPAIDKVPRLLSIPVGTQFYTPDTNEPLVKLGGTAPARVYSPFAVSATQYAVVISTGGVQQEARVNRAAVTVISSSPIT